MYLYPSQRMRIANNILSLMVADGTQFYLKDCQIYCYWINSCGERIDRQWQTIPHSDSFPAFHHIWGHGGTHCAALCGLARWIQERNVLPLSAWQQWIKNGLGVKKNQVEIFEILTNSWPKQSLCIFCKEPILGQFDWFGSGQKSGCGHIACGQKIAKMKLID